MLRLSLFIVLFLAGLGVSGYQALICVVEDMARSSLAALSSDNVAVSAGSVDYRPRESRVVARDVTARWKGGSQLRIAEMQIFVSWQGIIACCPRLAARFFSPFGRDILSGRIEAADLSFSGVDGTKGEAVRVSVTNLSAGRELMRALDSKSGPDFMAFSTLGADSLTARGASLEGPMGRLTVENFILKDVRGLDAGLLEFSDARYLLPAGKFFSGLQADTITARDIHISGGLFAALRERLFPDPNRSAWLPEEDTLGTALARNGKILGSLRIEGGQMSSGKGGMAFETVNAGFDSAETLLTLRGLVLPAGLLADQGLRLPGKAEYACEATVTGFLQQSICRDEPLDIALKLSAPGAAGIRMKARMTPRTGILRSFELRTKDLGGQSAMTAGLLAPIPGGMPLAMFCGPSASLRQTLESWAGTSLPLHVWLSPVGEGRSASDVFSHAGEALLADHDTGGNNHQPAAPSSVQENGKKADSQKVGGKVKEQAGEDENEEDDSEADDGDDDDDDDSGPELIPGLSDTRPDQTDAGGAGQTGPEQRKPEAGRAAEAVPDPGEGASDTIDAAEKLVRQ